MKENRAATPLKNRIASSMELHLARTLARSCRALLFLLSAGIFLFSCEEEIKPSSEASLTSLTLTVEGVDYAVTFTGKQGTITVPYATPLPVTATVKTVVLSAKATGIKVGDSVTIPVSGTVTLTVTAEDNTTKGVYTILVKKETPRSETSIASLTLTVGDSDYDIMFEDRQDTITLPYGTAIPAVVSVESVTLSPGATGVANDDELPVRNNAVTFMVTAENGTTQKTYTIALSVAPDTEASITALTLNAGGTDYPINFINRADTLTLPEDTALPATVKVVSIDVFLGSVDVAAGNDVPVSNGIVTLTVTGEDGTTKQYTVTLVVSQAAATGPLFTSFKFTAEGNEAMALEAVDRKEIVGTVDNDAKSITFPDQSAYVYLNRLKAAFTTPPGATVQVGGADQTSGVTEQDFSSPVSYVVRAQDGTETTYTVTLIKSTLATIPDASFRAKLKEFFPTAFIEDQLDITHDEVLNYNGQFRINFQTPRITSLKGVEFFTALTFLDCHANDLTSLNVSKNTALTFLDCSINSLTSLDMTGMRSIANFGALNIIGRGETDNPLLATLRVNIALRDAPAIVAMKTNRGADLTITTVDDEGAVVCADYRPLAGGGRCGPLSNEDLITSLTLTVGSTDYEVAFTDRAYTLTLPENSTLPTTVSVTSVTLSAGAAGIVDNDEFPVTEGGIVTLEVIAEDGQTKQYTVTLVVSQAATTGPLFTSFKFTLEGNEAMALEEADRKEIEGTIDNDAKSITFPDQSAYVYLNRLKATFTTSPGATVQVGGADQTSGVTEQDFSSAVSYVVRAQNGTETTYTVTLIKSTLATIPDASFRAKLQEFFPTAFTGDQLDITHDEVLNNRGKLDVTNQIPRITSLKGVEFFTALTRLVCGRNSLTSLDVSKNTALTGLLCNNNSLISLNVSKNTALTELYCNNNSLTFLDMTGMRSIGYFGALNIGTGTGQSNPLLATLKVNTALQDRTEVVAVKTNRGAVLTITTVDDEGAVVCADYRPLAGGGRCGPLSNEDLITSLTLTVGGRDYEVAFTDRAYTLTLPADAALPTVVSVKTVTLYAGAAGIVDNDEFPVTEAGIVTLEVVAEDGQTTQQYTVTLVVSQVAAPLFTSFKFTTEDNEAMALEEADRKEIVGTIDNDAKSITFPTQSAYVYLNRLKADFTTSTGATVQVGDRTQTSGFTAQDFTSSVAYVIRNQDGTETTYTVTLAKSTMATIPDPSFRAKLQELFPTAFTEDQLDITHDEVLNNRGQLIVNFQNPRITSLKGIEFFTALTHLDCHANNFISLNVSKNTALTFLDCSGNKLTSLDVSANTSLLNLNCSFNSLISLNVSKNTALTTLNCGNNLLTSLNMTGMRSVTTLNIGRGTGTDNLLETLRVNTVLQDRTEIITMKTARGADLTVITVDDGGTVVCDGYSPLAGGGRCGPLSNDASITALTLTVGGTDYEITFTDRAYTLILPAGSAVPTAVEVKEITLSDGATSDVGTGTELTVSDDAVTITVTAENGTTTNTYTVTSGFATTGITSFVFTIEGNENRVLDVADRQRIVGKIDQQAKTITFDEQSAYVYPDKLKATFDVSEIGTTVQVGGVDQISGVTEQDFTSPVTYVVRFQGGTEKTYTVTLTKSTLATIPDASFRAKLKELFPTAFTEDQLDITHDEVVNNSGRLNIPNQTPKITSLKGIEFFTTLTTLNCGNNNLTSLDVSANTNLRALLCGSNSLDSLNLSVNTALAELFCEDNNLTFLDMTGMRRIGYNGALGIGTNNPLATLRVNTAVQDDAAIITVKTNRGAALTVTTVNNEGTVVCADYTPAQGGGTCNDN